MVTYLSKIHHGILIKIFGKTPIYIYLPETQISFTLKKITIKLFM